MLKKILLFVAVSLMFAGTALAAVEVNSADQAALDGIAGVGPSTSKAIIAERDKHGNFKDWADLERRVKGIGGRNAVKLSAAGLMVNGQSHTPGAKAGAAAGPKASEQMGKPAAEKYMALPAAAGGRPLVLAD